MADSDELFSIVKVFGGYDNVWNILSGGSTAHNISFSYKLYNEFYFGRMTDEMKGVLDFCYFV